MKQIVKYFTFGLLILVTISSCRNPSEPGKDLPIIEITSHVENQNVSKTVSIDYRVTKEINIKEAVLFVDGYSQMWADTSNFFTINWDTKQLSDQSYTIKIRIVDSSDMEYFSDPITLNVNNSPFRPNPVNVLSVTYNKYEMEITWEKSNATDFSHYSVHHFIGTIGKLLGTIKSVNDTTFTINDFDPTISNEFTIAVIDSEGYQVYSAPQSNSIEQTPLTPIIKNTEYSESVLKVEWNKNTEDDFLYYVLYESSFAEMQHKTIAFYSENANDTTYSYTIGENEDRFFQLEVFDYWNLSTESEIKYASSYPKIAFISNRDGISDIYSMNSDGSNVVNLTNSNGAESYPQLVPNSKKIIYMIPVWGTNGLHNELFIMNNDGTNQTQVTFDSRIFDSNIAVSGDGNKIAYSDDYSLYLVDLNTYQVIKIYSTDKNITYIDFSSNSEKLIFNKIISNNSYQISTINLDGSNLLSIKYVNGWSGSPTYFTKNDRIVYNKSTLDSSAVFIMDYDGSNEINLTSNYTKSILIGIFNYDNLLLVESGDSSQLNPMIIDLNGNIINSLRLSAYYKPQFSPNNEKIVFHQSDWYNNEGHHNIYTINIDGTNKIKLTDDSTYDIQPIWLYH